LNKRFQSRTEPRPPARPVEAPKAPLRVIDRAEVLRRIPVCWATLWQWQQEGKFPKAVSLGGPDKRRVGFFEHEIEEFLLSRPKVLLKADRQKQKPPRARGGKLVTKQEGGAPIS
jgi:predicted DNA-binding transcriptional regulator AlpA